MIRLLIVAALLYPAYITATCPCEKINGCHKKEFIASTTVALVLGTAAANGLV